jgi:hypothetical protein
MIPIVQSKVSDISFNCVKPNKETDKHIRKYL